MGEARVHVLREVSFSATPGTVTAIVGPSGCGKSTLLYLLGLLDRPEGGEIWIGGHNLAQADDAQRTAVRNEHIGFVFQFHFLLPEFTALENVMLPMDYARMYDFEERPKRALQLLTLVGLEQQARKLPMAVSTGQQQLAAIARALATDPIISK